MKKLQLVPVLALALLAVGCVTINVYFPAAAAEKAAQKFIGNVIGEPGMPAAPASSNPPADTEPDSGGMSAAVWNLLIPAAQAAEPVDLKVSTPELEALRASMRARFANSLKPLLNSGAIGFTHDGMIALHDNSKIPLAQRNQVRQTIEAENQDRAEVYQRIAKANGHPEWESKIRSTFAREWIVRAHSGWYYQDGSGTWQRK